MAPKHPVDALAEISRRFGPAEARDKVRLLGEIPSEGRLSVRHLKLLQDSLNFMRAYPDDARVLGAARSGVAALREAVDRTVGGDHFDPSVRNTGLPGNCNSYSYSYTVLQRLVALYPGRLDLEWDEIEEVFPLTDALILAGAAAEARGLEDPSIELPEWLECSRADPRQTTLETTLQILRESTLGPREQIHVYDSLNLPVLYPLTVPGAGRCEIGLRSGRVSYRSKPIPKERFPLKPRILRPLTGARLLGPARGRRMIDLALAALCCRNLEIHALAHANPQDVTRIDCGRGLSVVLVGMVPEFRETPETLLFFLILKNGVPIAYGPASIFLGCCEMGINLFPEFRGGEIRFVYAQLMRALHHLAGVRYFYLLAYGMGEDNPDALRSGAFWFYRRLGFRATNPEVEALAREEERIMRRRPGYRCPMAVLRQLSHTEAHFDLSGGDCRPLDFGRLGQSVTRAIAEKFRGNRGRAERLCARRLSEILGIHDHSSWSTTEKVAMRRLAPILTLLPDLESWPARDRRSLARIVRAKGGRSVLAYARRESRHPRLAAALHEIASEPVT